MTCRDLSGFLLEYVGGELPADVQAEFERHLVDCANCREFLKQYRDTIAAGKTVLGRSGTELTPEVPDELVKAVLDTIGRK